MSPAPDRFRRFFWMVTGVHVAAIAGMLLFSVVQQWWLRRRPREVVTFVSLHTPVAPESVAAPAAPDPPPPPPPPPPPAPRPQVQRSQQRVRRDQTPPPPQPEPQLTREQIRQQLQAAVPDATPRPAATDERSRYYALLHETFVRAWSQPGSVLPGTAAVGSIRVQRDGTITRRELQRRSGNDAMDRSVLQAMESVARLSPLPAAFPGAHHDFTITFELTGAAF
jgi:TonB family protein